MSNPNGTTRPRIDSSDAALDAALLLASLRQLVRRWRDRADVAPPEHGRIYQQVERDLSELIHDHHPERQACWAAARRDLVQAVVEALVEELDRRDAGRRA